MLQDEAMLIEQRVNQQTATEASLISAAINAAFSKDNAKAFNAQVDSLSKPVTARTVEPLHGEKRPEDPATDYSAVDVAALYGPDSLTGSK